MTNKNPKALFIVGGPGSGKDFIVKGIISDHKISELPQDKLINAIITKSNLKELSSPRNVIVNGTADNLNNTLVSKAVLERMGYDTAMVYVYTTDAESRARNDRRLSRGAKTIGESVRAKKYQSSVKNMHEFKDKFNTFVLFNNSDDIERVNEEKQVQLALWLAEVRRDVAHFLGEVYTSTANDDSQGNVNNGATNSPTENPQTVISKNKVVPAKKKKTNSRSVTPPPNYFNAALGTVPAGGIGLTSSYTPTHGKTIAEIRGK